MTKFIKLTVPDAEVLFSYLNNLGSETRKRFNPHGFDRDSLLTILQNGVDYPAYAVLDDETGLMVAYSVVRKGFPEHDKPRLASYGLFFEDKRDCVFAPSVADEWQGKGMGTAMFGFVVNDLKAAGFNRILLWGGVQRDNKRAVRFYLRNGFRILGEFENEGPNYDMIFRIS